ncbi:MAG: gp436 family protein [Paracoccaceae bacterium]
MPYTSQQILIDRYGEHTLVQATDRGDVATGTVDTDVVDRVLIDTDAVIDAHISGRYRLPVATVPPLLVTIASEIAIYKLHVYEPDPKLKADYEAAMKSLTAISLGNIRLPIDGVEAPQTGNSGAEFTDRERPFTETNLKGFI